jgi:hypothetical protein
MNPFESQREVAIAPTSGALQNQSRELAETQTKYLMAQRFPRDVVANMDKILNDFTRPSLAEKAAYQFARGGTDITGPSIRAAEAIAQKWQNIEQGWRELSRGINGEGVPFSEVEAYCVDLEGRSSKRLQFIVKHWRDTKQGGYKLKDERDIYELCANQAQRRVRACILAMIPGDVIDAAMDQAEVTLKTSADTSPEAMAKMVAAFAQWEITKDHIEKRIQRRLDAIQPAQVVALKRIYASLRDEMSEPSDWFEIEKNVNTGPAVEISNELLKGARDAAGKGSKVFDKYWALLPVESRSILTTSGMYQQLKNMIANANANAKSAKAPSPPPAATNAMAASYDAVMAAMVAAGDAEKLQEAADLIGAVESLKDRANLSAAYHDLMGNFKDQP